MKLFRITIIIAAIFTFSCDIGKTAPADSFATASNEVWSTFDAYVVQKHDLARDLAKKHRMEMPLEAENFFDAAQKHDWAASTNLFFALGEEKQKATKPSYVWGAIQDVYGAFEVLHWLNPEFAKMFGTEMVQDIPTGSIYFGGTEAGRYLVSTFSKSHSKGQPFYTITQNALTDPSYNAYVADMYGGKIYVADARDSQKCFDDYKADARGRILHDQTHPNEPRQIKPGEDVHLDADGNVQASGQVSVMAVNALISKVIFDKNPTKEFYVDESFPLDWMFPHLTPSGLTLKINRAEIPELNEDALKKDHEFWRKFCAPLIGDWITYDTSVKDLTAFAEKVVKDDNYEGFKGDPDFMRNEPAQGAFSKLRSSIAGVYTWRIGQPPSGGTMPAKYISSGANRKLIEREADFAFKQAFALCPVSGEVVFRYVQLLVNSQRADDALLISETAQKLSPRDANFRNLVDGLKRIKQTPSAAEVQNEITRLEKAVDSNPTNMTQQFELAQEYFQAGQNENAYKILDGVLSNSNATLPMVMSVADAYSRLNQPAKLQKALEALTRLVPDSPEAWYDLSASHAMMGQNTQAIDTLRKALELNASRLTKDLSAKDIRLTLAADERFAKLRDTPEFKAMVKKQ
jgi:tetratricopeptide (TPR) repeat protein